MDVQKNNFALNEAARIPTARQQAARPKTWQRNQRKFVKPYGVKSNGHSKIEKPRTNSWKGFDPSSLTNVPENSIMESFIDKREQQRLMNVSDDFRNNGFMTNEILPFSTMEPAQFSHTFPKPIGWGRKSDLGSTMKFSNNDNRDPVEHHNFEPTCLGILSSKMDPIKRPECAFCKRNNAKDYFHLLKDELGGVVCPILSAFTCKMCAATGRNAHTHKYCPVNPITKGDPVAAGMPPGRPLTKADKEWLKYFHTKFLLQLLEGNKATQVW